MSDITWQSLRENSQSIAVYNEGLVVYLWDESHRAQIEASGADFESGYAESDADIDAGLKHLAKQDLLIAYELFQDDPVKVEVIVGPALTKKELASACWFKPQLGRLKLPSGRLRLDTANTLPLSGSTTDEAAGIVTVPPGDYVIQLYRLDWDKLVADALLKEGEAWQGPQEILLLTPSADAKPVKSNKPLLRFGTPPSWHGKYKVVDGVFIGQAQAHTARAGFQVNMDAAALASLGVDIGTLLKIDVDQLTVEAVFVGDRDPMQLHRHQSYHLAGTRPEFGYAYRLIWDADSQRVLTVERSVSAADFPAVKKRIPVRVSVLPERLEVPR